MRVRIMKIPLVRLDRLSREEETGIHQGHSDSKVAWSYQKIDKKFLNKFF